MIMSFLRRASVRVGANGRQAAELKAEEMFAQRFWSVGSPHAQLAVQRCARTSRQA